MYMYRSEKIKINNRRIPKKGIFTALLDINFFYVKWVVYETSDISITAI